MSFQYGWSTSARLPRLTSGTDCWYLPFAGFSAWALLDVLLAKGIRQSYPAIRDAVQHDPSLTLWSICTADHSTGTELRTLDKVAQWLVSHGIRDHLSWSDEELQSQPRRDQTDWKKWGQLAMESAAVASAVGTEATVENEKKNSAIDGEVTLLAFVHNAQQWLAASFDPSPPAPDVVTTCLPAWLADLLRGLTSDPRPGTEVASRVSRALQRENKESAMFQEADGRPCLDGSPQSWQLDAQSMARVFPVLLPRLLRLEALETDFARQLEQEKLHAMKELAYGAGHEINNPLANISSRAQTLLRQEEDPERRRRLATINSQAFRAHEMIANMMLFAHPPALEPQPVNLTALVNQVLDELRPLADEQETELRQRIVEPLSDIEADASHLRVALKALCTNSLEALGLGGHVELEVLEERSDGKTRGVTIAIHDTGPGISPEARRHLFDPFYSGREAGRGLGFGLSKAWRIVTLHGGSITVDSQQGVGATFTIRLPVRAAKESSATSTSAPSVSK